jgi:hypothetical protein
LGPFPVDGASGNAFPLDADKRRGTSGVIVNHAIAVIVFPIAGFGLGALATPALPSIDSLALEFSRSAFAQQRRARNEAQGIAVRCGWHEVVIRAAIAIIVFPIANLRHRSDARAGDFPA